MKQECLLMLSCWEVLQGIAPPTLNIEQPDQIFHDHFSPLTSPRTMAIKAVLTNSFGFGGTNASLVFTRPPSE